MLSQAIPELPDPLPVTCPYCGYSASYPKSAICSDITIINDKPSLTRWASILLVAIAIILVLGLIATRAHSAEPDPAPLHTAPRIAAMPTDRMQNARRHPIGRWSYIC
jgi:hypothetical protein